MMDKRAKAMTSARAILDKANGENRDMTPMTIRAFGRFSW
jgi:hypothetical protein